MDFGYRIGYKRYFSDVHYRHLLVNEEGVCFLVSSWSGTDDFQGEIGWYRGRLESRILAPVKECISGGSFLAGPEHRYDPSAGYVFEEFSFERGGTARKYSYGEEDKLPAPFEKLADLYAPLIRELRKHPWKVLHAGVDVADNDVRIGDYVNLAVTFRNIGSERLEFGNPYAASGGVVGFSLECERQNVPIEDLSDADVFAVDLKKAEMRLSEREVISAEPRLLGLAPSSEIRGTCRFRVPKCPPGEYAVRLVYVSSGVKGDTANRNYVDGELRTAARPMVVRKR